MIRNKLSILLTERDLKITKVANDTKISRTTLTAINQNESKMIQIETINTLCKYLKITPCDFFEYSPLDVSFSFDILDSLTTDEEILAGHPIMYKVIGYMNPTWYEEKIASIEFEGTLTGYGNIYENGGTHISLTINIDENSRESALKVTSLSVAFQSYILKEFKQYIAKDYAARFPNENTPDIDISFF